MSCRDGAAFRRAGASLSAAAAILLAFVAVTSLAAEPPDATVTLENAGPEKFNAVGQEITGRVCASACHGWDMIFGGPRQAPTQWDFIVEEMAARGAAATAEQLDLIKRYLKWSWGMVWINSASAQDLVAVLALPRKDADAVVAWRKEHGKFANLQSLKAVPGVDAAALDARVDAITFN